ncbi:MAG: insulinase family protein [Proteobacteria bacterium]|nr:insulinase family protein [Pseudomonadota bacterium]
MKKQVSLLFLILIGWSSQGSCMEKAVTVEKKLDNGLKVVVREDHRAPVVVAQIWYKVGSTKERRGNTGVSHALEHMMFQGTPTLPGDGFAGLISQYGGRNNAFTGEDYTAYYEELDTANLAVSFEAEADRMQNLILSPEAFAKEIQVVIEERRTRTQDNPQNFTWERFMATANPTGPYHNPVIGWQDDLDQMTIEDLRDWYQKWYAPNNATLVVVGDVNAENVFALAERYFGKIPSRQLPVDKPLKEIPAMGEKRIKVSLPAKLPYMIWGYDVPTLKSTDQESDAYALVLTSALLDGGESARLQRDLIRGQQVASSVGTHYDVFKPFATQFVFVGIPAEGHTTSELEEKIQEQIQLLKTQLVSAEELQKAKTQLLAQEVFEKDSMSDQATLLGLLETVGLSWPVADSFVEKIKAVTPEQIQHVAQKYFDPQRLTVAELVPEKTAH